jgi:hypothetical protein
MALRQQLRDRTIELVAPVLGMSLVEQLAKYTT